MADVTVFVDDAVLGRLPGVCVNDGVATTSRLRISEEIGGSNRLGILWLLFFAGPLGWIVLLFLATRSSGERLAVEVPFSEAAYDRYVQARRLRTGAVVVGVAATVGLLWLTAWANLGELGAIVTLVAAFAGIATFFTAEWRISLNSIRVDLDASRRWVTLRRVHPAFASACEEQRARQYQT